MRAVAERRLDAHATTFRRHLDLCLGCRACETACPAGVPFGSLLETTRAEIERRGPPAPRAAAAVADLRGISRIPSGSRALLAVVRLYRRSGLQRARAPGGAAPPVPAADGDGALLADVPARDAVCPSSCRRAAARAAASALLTGCVQRHLYRRRQPRHGAAALALAGWDVVVPRAQGCCGALDLHAGRLDVLRGRAHGAGGGVPRRRRLGRHQRGRLRLGHAGVRSLASDEAADAPRRSRTRDVSELLADAELPLGPLQR